MISYICNPARVAKLVDAPSSGGGAARCAGSNPVPGTKALLYAAGGLFCFGSVTVIYISAQNEKSFSRVTGVAY